jgi:hypothetical protein
MTWTMLRLVLGRGRGSLTRLALVGLGTALATGFLLAAALVHAIPVLCTDGGSACDNSYSVDLLAQPGLRPGVSIALVLLVVPVLVFLGMCSRIDAARRDRRLAALRLAGATPAQVRSLSALDTGLPAVVGTVVGYLVFLIVKASLATPAVTRHSLPTNVPMPVASTIIVLLGVPLLATATAVVALRRVVLGPLAAFRLTETRRLRPWWVAATVAGVALLVVAPQLYRNDGGSLLPIAAAAVITMLGLVASGSWLAVTLGATVAGRTRSVAAVIAGRRLQADPIGQGRAISAVVLAVYFAAGAAVLRADAIATQNQDGSGFYSNAFDLVGVALGVALLVGAAGLLVAAVESVTERRRSLAAMVATGVPLATLRRAVMLQSLIPAIPAVVLATVAGALSGQVFTSDGDRHLVLPVVSLLGVIVIALLAIAAVTALTLPLLRRSVQPSELRVT